MPTVVIGTITDPGGRPPPEGSAQVILVPHDYTLPSITVDVAADGTYTTGDIDGGVVGNEYDIHVEMIQASAVSGPTRRTRSYISLGKFRNDTDVIGSVLQSGGGDKKAKVSFNY